MKNLYLIITLFIISTTALSECPDITQQTTHKGHYIVASDDIFHLTKYPKSSSKESVPIHYLIIKIDDKYNAYQIMDPENRNDLDYIDINMIIDPLTPSNPEYSDMIGRLDRAGYSDLSEQIISIQSEEVLKDCWRLIYATTYNKIAINDFDKKFITTLEQSHQNIISSDWESVPNDTQKKIKDQLHRIIKKLKKSYKVPNAAIIWVNNAWFDKSADKYINLYFIFREDEEYTMYGYADERVECLNKLNYDDLTAELYNSCLEKISSTIDENKFSSQSDIINSLTLPIFLDFPEKRIFSPLFLSNMGCQDLVKQQQPIDLKGLVRKELFESVFMEHLGGENKDEFFETLWSKMQKTYLISDKKTTTPNDTCYSQLRHASKQKNKSSIFYVSVMVLFLVLPIYLILYVIDSKKADKTKTDNKIILLGVQSNN